MMVIIMDSGGGSGIGPCISFICLDAYGEGEKYLFKHAFKIWAT